MRGSRSVSDSGCHCTPSRNCSPADSSASIEAVGRHRGGDQARGEVMHRLVVHAVHLERRRADQGVEPRARGDGHLVRQVVAGVARGGEVVVLDGVGALRGDVLVERAAERDVEDLEPAAEPEQRLPLGDGPAREAELHPVAGRVEPAAGRQRRLAVGRGIQVHAAGDEDRVDAVVERRAGCPLRPAAGSSPAGPPPRPRAGVALVHDPRLRQPLGDAVDGVQGLGWDPDDRSAAHA